MSDTEKAEDLGRMSPVQVVQCAEGSNTVCWIRAETTADDGTTTSYECCGGGGQKATFTVRTGFLSPQVRRSARRARRAELEQALRLTTAGTRSGEAGTRSDEVDVMADPPHVARPKVLFICTGNTARSQMAEGFLRALAGERFDAYSAGLEPGELHPLTVQVMKERGIDVSGQRAKSLDEYLGKLSFAYVITVCDRAARKCPVFAGTGERLHWSFEDPAETAGGDAQTLAKFREVRDADRGAHPRVARDLARGDRRESRRR